MEMTWNKPGEGSEKNDSNREPNRDPWSGKPKQSPDQSKGPPDLDEALRKLRNQLGGLFGNAKKPGGSRGQGAGQGSIPQMNRSSFSAILGVIFLIWAASGIFIVDPSEQAVILRFGKYQETVGPGPHWIPRFIYTKTVLNTERIEKYDYSALMLTKDANVVSAELTVQYRVSNPKDYLFNLTSAKLSLEQATASALRQVIGQTTLDSILTVDREKVRKGARDTLVAILEKYHSGLTITDVSFQQAKAPDEVKDAFDDAIKAQEDEKKFQNRAEAYAKEVEPKAQGQAQRLLADADAYKQQSVLQAQGEVARYLAILPYYQKSPAVTRDRLYIDAIESVLSHTTKIIVDTKGSNMFYLPLDKLMPQLSASAQPPTPPHAVAVPAAGPVTSYEDPAPVQAEGNQPASSAVSSTSAEAQMKGGY
jgi:modulator of FtsH protease HflK